MVIPCIMISLVTWILKVLMLVLISIFVYSTYLALVKSAKSEDVRKLKIQQAEHTARVLKELSEKVDS